MPVNLGEERQEGPERCVQEDTGAARVNLWIVTPFVGGGGEEGGGGGERGGGGGVLNDPFSGVTAQISCLSDIYIKSHNRKLTITRQQQNNFVTGVTAT